MATESELADLLDLIGDRAATNQDALDRFTSRPRRVTPSRRRWLPVAATVAVVSIGAIVSASVSSRDPHQAPVPARAQTSASPALSAPPTPAHQAFYPLPLNAYYASAAQARTLQRAQFVLAQRCASIRGVSVPTVHVPAADAPAAFLAGVADSIRPVSLQQARTLGYGLYPRPSSAFSASVAGLSPRQLEIFEGWSSGLKLAKPTSSFLLGGGCYEQAARTLLKGATPVSAPVASAEDGQPGLFEDDTTVTNLYVNDARSGETSPAVRRAQKRWSVCMAAHHYPGLHSTADTIEHRSKLDSAAARRQAVQDVRCKQSTGFIPVWIAAMTKAQNAVIAAHRSQLVGFQQRLATRMANATKALR